MNQDILHAATYLIVDDESVNVCILEQMLARWGCTAVHSTTDPFQVVPLFLEHRPDIVLLDLMMPRLDGFQVMEALLPHIDPEDFLPILIITADQSLDTRRRALSAGAKDFLTKPVDYVELTWRLRNLLQSRFMHCELRDRNGLLEAQVRERTQQLRLAEIETVECLAAASEYRDDDTGLHTRRVGNMAALLAQELGMDSQTVDLVRRAAPLHDVGKIGISDLILLKPGRLTPEEFEIMKQHTTIGAGILSRHHTPLLQMASEIALTHHERWTGGGYPRNLHGEEIPLVGRIVALADIFDALTNERPYKKPWPVSQAMAEIHSMSGTHLDPAVVDAFLHLSLPSQPQA